MQLATLGVSCENFQNSLVLIDEIPVAHHLSPKPTSFNLGIQKYFNGVIHLFVQSVYNSTKKLLSFFQFQCGV